MCEEYRSGSYGCVAWELKVVEMIQWVSAVFLRLRGRHGCGVLHVQAMTSVHPMIGSSSHHGLTSST